VVNFFDLMFAKYSERRTPNSLTNNSYVFCIHHFPAAWHNAIFTPVDPGGLGARPRGPPASPVPNGPLRHPGPRGAAMRGSAPRFPTLIHGSARRRIWPHMRCSEVFVTFPVKYLVLPHFEAEILQRLEKNLTEF